MSQTRQNQVAGVLPPLHPMQVGTKLRDARRSRKLTIHDVSRATKISERLLESIDRNDIAAVPGEFFARAFLKAYAAEVGLDPAQIAREYVEELSAEMQAQVVAAAPAAPEPRQARSISFALTLVVGLTAATAAFALIFNQMQSRDSARSLPRPAAASPDVGSMATSGTTNLKPVDKPQEISNPPVPVRPSKPSDAKTSARQDDRRVGEAKRPARPAARKVKPAADDPSPPRATETVTPPITEPTEASPPAPTDETSPSQDPLR